MMEGSSFDQDEEMTTASVDSIDTQQSDTQQSRRSSRVYSAFIPLNKMSIRNKGMSFIRNIYSSTVEIPSYYTERKHEEYWTWKYVLRKIAGIPFVIGYGFLLAWIISDFIIRKQDVRFTHSSFEQNNAKDVCALVNYNNSIYKNKTVKVSATYGINNLRGNVDNNTNYTTNLIDNVTTSTAYGSKILFKNDSPVLYVATFISMGMIGFISLFSRNTRCTLFLILPGLATKHSRNFIFTIVLGILANSPWNNIRHNINNVFENGVCMYRTGLILACSKNKQVGLLLKDSEKLYRDITKLRRRFDDVFCGEGNNCRDRKYPPYKYANYTWQNLADAAASSTNTVKLQVAIVLDRINSLGDYAEIARKCLTIASIIWLIIDAVRYLKSYYTDSSFDNMYIEGSIPQIWERKDYKKVTPLKHWEIKEGYRVSRHPSFNKKIRFLRKILATIIFIMFVGIVLTVDYVIAKALNYIKTNEDFHSSLKSMGHNVTGYNTESCLKNPEYTQANVYWTISLLLSAAIASCVLEVYTSRLRPRMCNLFYPDRAEERADYLFYKILSGRIIRRYQLLLIVRREIERRLKLARFSPIKRFTKCLSRMCGRRKRHIICPGCGVKVKSSKAVNVAFIVVEKEINAKVCKNCELDLSFGKNKIDDINIYDSKTRVNETSLIKKSQEELHVTKMK